MADNNQENRKPQDDEKTDKKETIFSIVQHFFKNYNLRKTSSKTQLTEEKDQHSTEAKENNGTDNEATPSCSSINTSNRAPINANTRNVLTENSVNTRRGKIAQGSFPSNTISDFTELSASAKYGRKSLSPRNAEMPEHLRNSRNQTALTSRKSLSPKIDNFQEHSSNSKNLNSKCSRKSLSPQNDQFQGRNSNSKNLNAKYSRKSLSPKNDQFQERNSNSKNLSAKCNRKSTSPSRSEFQEYIENSENLSPEENRDGTASAILRGHAVSTSDLLTFSGSLRGLTAKRKNQTLSLSQIPKCESKPENANSGREGDRVSRSNFIRNTGCSSRNEADSVCENLRRCSLSNEVSNQTSLEVCRTQSESVGGVFARNIEDISQRPSPEQFQLNISISRGDTRSERIDLDHRLIQYINCNLRLLTKLNLQSGGVIFLNSEGLNISFAKLQPDMSHIVSQTATCISVLNVPLMCGGTVILENAAEGFTVPNYYTENTPYVVQPVCECARCNELDPPLSSSPESEDDVPKAKKKITEKEEPMSESATSHSGGCMIEDPYRSCKAVLPELFPSRMALPPDHQVASSSAYRYSGGRLMELNKEDEVFLSLFHQSREEKIPVEMQGHTEDAQAYRQRERANQVGRIEEDDVRVDTDATEEMDDIDLADLIDSCHEDSL